MIIAIAHLGNEDVIVFMPIDMANNVENEDYNTFCETLEKGEEVWEVEPGTQLHQYCVYT